MANYRRRSSHSYGGKKQGSFAWIWLLTGIILGILSVIYAYPLLQNGLSFDSIKRFGAKKDRLEPHYEAGATLEQKVIIKKKNPEKEQYEFYTMLPDMEVALPKEKPPTIQRDPEIIPLVKEQKAPEKGLSPAMINKKFQAQKNSAKAKAAKEMAIKEKDKSAKYLIQAGMYRTLKEADGLKARLALLGFNTRLQKIDAEDGLWFRVIMGPFPNENLALEQQKRLITQNVKAVLVKQRKLK